MRTDTEPPMRKGKMIAQGAHASLSFLSNRIRNCFDDSTKSGKVKDLLKLTPEILAWIQGNFAKICVRVDSEEELIEIHKNALAAGLESSLITDSGLTEFGKPTKTCLAIGPDKSEKIDKITGHLKLL